MYSILFMINEQKKNCQKTRKILISLKNYEQNLNIKNCADMKFLKKKINKKL